MLDVFRERSKLNVIIRLRNFACMLLIEKNALNPWWCAALVYNTQHPVVLYNEHMEVIRDQYFKWYNIVSG